MNVEDGTWVMYGVKWDNPECIHTVEEAIAYIEEVGFLPLFRNDIPGFFASSKQKVFLTCDIIIADM